MVSFAVVPRSEAMVARAAQQRRYAKTLEGRAVQTRATKRYRQTEKGKVAVKKDGMSASHAAAQLKYSRSVKGKAAAARWRNSPGGRAYFSRREAANAS